MIAAMLATMAPAPLAPAPRRLSETQVSQVLAGAAARREAGEQVHVPPERTIHGEVGVSVGTGGYRAAFGTAVVPLGQTSGAVISISTETRRDRHVRYRR